MTDEAMSSLRSGIGCRTTAPLMHERQRPFAKFEAILNF